MEVLSDGLEKKLESLLLKVEGAEAEHYVDLGMMETAMVIKLSDKLI